jgi:hypothetical protein
MNESIDRLEKSLNQFYSKHKGLILRLFIILLFFLIPLGRFIPLQGVGLPQLKMDVTPLGYPIDGGTWEIKTWGSVNNGVDWTTLGDVNISVTTHNNGTFHIISDEDGKATFQYLKTMGTVAFHASHKEYGTYDWVPEESFVDNNLSLLVLGIFGVGTPSFIWQLLAKNRRSNKIEKALFYSLLGLTVIGWTLSFFWFYEWKLGTEWGFGNAIINLGFYSIDFYPHLWTIFLIVLVLVFLSFLASLAYSLFGKSDRKRKSRDYVV